MKVQVHIDTTAKALDKRDRSRVHSIPCSATCDGLIDVILRDGTADNRMHLRRQVLRSRHPVAQGDGHRDDPLPRGDPGDDLLDEMCRHLRHAPPGTRRTKPASLATEGHQELVVAGVTAQAQKAMGKNPTPQIVIKFALDIGRQAHGIRISLARGEKGLQVLRDHVVEHRAAGIPGCVGGNGWRHTNPHRQQGENGNARSCPPIYYSNVQYTSKKLTRECEGNMRDASPCRAAVAKSAFEILIHASGGMGEGLLDPQQNSTC